MSTNATDAFQSRTVSRIVEPQPVVEGAGVRLKRSIATRALDYLDPFLLFDHFGSDDPGDYIKGFPMHPHRGIETVTYMLAGLVEHKDSIGNAGSITVGDVQWMTSGGGIMHEEMPKPIEGKMEGFQLWVNLPAKLKMSKPRYQEIPSATIPEISTDNGIVIRVIAGELDNIVGPVTDIAANPIYLDVMLPANTIFTQPIEKGHTAFTYLFRGGGLCGITDEGHGTKGAAPLLAVLSDGNAIRVQSGDQGMRFLLVSGRPLNDPIARYGPFVMNTQQEIEQALDDLRNGTFVWAPR